MVWVAIILRISVKLGNKGKRANMIIANLLGTGKISLATLAGAAAGVAADMGVPISEATHISLGAAVGAATTVVLVAWYLSSKLTRIQDRLDRVESILTNLPGVKQAERQAHLKRLADEGD